MGKCPVVSVISEKNMPICAVLHGCTYVQSYIIIIINNVLGYNS